MYRSWVVEQLQAYASGSLSRAELVEWAAPIYADEDLLADEGTDDEPWRSGDDDTSLLLWLVHLADAGSGSDVENRRDIARALACYEATSAGETLRLMWLILDQDRLCGVLEKVEQGIISRTGFLSMVSNAHYDAPTKAWLTGTTPAGLRYLRRLLQDEAYDEVASLLRSGAPGAGASRSDDSTTDRP